MSLAEFGWMIRGVAKRNGNPIGEDAPDEDEFFEALRLSEAEGTA